MAVSEGDIVKVVLEYIYPGAGVALNVLHFVYGGIDRENEDFVESMVDWVTTLWAPGWAGLSSSVAELDRLDVTKVNGLGVAIEDIGSDQVGVTGVNVAAQVDAAGVAAYLQAGTNTPGVYGRKYIPGIAELTTDQGLFNNAALVAMGLIGTAWVTPAVLLNGGTIFPAIISTKIGDAVRLNPEFTVESIPAYQRRRKVGVGT